MGRKASQPSKALRVALTAATIAFLVAAGLAEPAGAQQNPNRGQNAGNAEVHVWPVRGNVYMLIGAGGNITLSVGKDGVLLVDTGTPEMTDKVLAAIRQLTRQRDPGGPATPIRYIINTHVHRDHTGGNANIAETSLFDPVQGGEQIVAHINVHGRMDTPGGNEAPIPARAMPTDTYFTEQYRINRFFNGEGVQIIHLPAAHTDGDSIVWFRYSDVISAGDVFTNTHYPVIDLGRGGSVQGIIDGLNRIIDVAFPEFRSQGGTMIIPGHGGLCDLADVAYYRDMVTIVRDRIQDMMKKGMTLEQVKAAKPTLDYDPLYGTTPGSTDTFVESVYRSLSQKR